MALDQLDTIDHGPPVIVLLVLCPIVLIMVIVYYRVIYPCWKDRRRRKEMRDSANASASTSSLVTAEATRRELHRWIPSLLTPTAPRFPPVPHTPQPRDSVSGYSFQTGSLSPAPSGRSTRSLHQYSLPISELDTLPISNVAVPLTAPLPTAIRQDATGHVGHWPHHDHDQDPFADQGPSYVRGAEPDAHAHDSAVAVPTPAASIRSSVDAMSITTSSTLPPSYRTHRPTHGTASDAPLPFLGHGRRPDMAHTAAEEHGPSSYQAPSDRRSRYYPRKSMDGGVRLDGGPLDPATGRGPEEPPQYGKKL